MDEPHDYEPSDGARCRVCGQSRSACDLRATIDARWVGATRPTPRTHQPSWKLRFSKP